MLENVTVPSIVVTSNIGKLLELISDTEITDIKKKDGTKVTFGEFFPYDDIELALSNPIDVLYLETKSGEVPEILKDAIVESFLAADLKYSDLKKMLALHYDDILKYFDVPALLAAIGDIYLECDPNDLPSK